MRPEKRIEWLAMPDLSLKDKQKLIELARAAIKTCLEGDPRVVVADFPALQEKCGCFVTLRKQGSLRGCVGTFDTSKPLYENIQRMAVAAATQDARFSPVTKSELDEMRIEISVLGPLEKVESLEEIQLGTHGVYVRYGNRSGTFLPDVAIEKKWNVAEFVTVCAREKAGLTPAEIQKAEIFRYEVVKINEDETR